MSTMTPDGSPQVTPGLETEQTEFLKIKMSGWKNTSQTFDLSGKRLTSFKIQHRNSKHPSFCLTFCGYNFTPDNNLSSDIIEDINVLLSKTPNESKNLVLSYQWDRDGWCSFNGTIIIKFIKIE